MPLKDGLQAFRAVYMPARNYADRTREEYASDIENLVSCLESRKLTSWLVVGLRDLQLYMAELDRRGEEEYQALLAQVLSIRDRAILELFLQTDLRLSELVNLIVSNLELPRRLTKDPENVGMIRVHRKRGKEVYLPLNWKACEALAAWLIARREMARNGSADDALFLSNAMSDTVAAHLALLTVTAPSRSPHVY